MNTQASKRHTLWEWAIAAALLLVAFGFRTYRLADAPPGLHHDDVKNIILVQKIMDGYLRVYYPENYGHEPLYHWLQAVYFRLLGTGYPENRLLNVGISMVGLAAVYVLIKRLLGRNVALWSLAWQAVSLWPLFYSRRGIRGVLLIPLAALSGYFFARMLSGHRRRDGALGGLCLAAALYTYMGSRVLPLFFALLVLYLALFDRPRLRACWPGLVLFFAVALTLALPLGLYLVSHPEERIDQINLPLQALRQGDWMPLLRNSLRALGMFSFVGDPHWRQFVADTPVFEPLGAILFYAGIATALWNWRKWEYFFVLAWAPVMLIPAMVSEGAPNFLRPIAALVAVYVFPALDIDWLLGRLNKPMWGRLALGGAMIALLGWNAWRTWDGYFVRWAAHPDARFAYNATLLDEARYLDQTPVPDNVVLAGHFPADLDPALADSYVRRTALALRWCDIRQALIFPAGSSASVFQPDHFPIDSVLFSLFFGEKSPTAEHHLPDGRFVFAVYRSDGDLLAARLAAARDNPVGWSRAAAFPDGQPIDWTPLAAPTFDGRVSLLGYEVLNGAVHSGDVALLLTYWQVSSTEGEGGEGITFVHALDPAGRVVGGFDGFGAPPSRWIAGDVIVQLHRFALPIDLEPGSYPLEIGWYEPGSGVRWTVPLPGGGQVDRLLLAPLRVIKRGKE